MSCFKKQPKVASPPARPSKIPSVNLLSGFPPTPTNMAEYCAGKNVVILGIPGAFTPVCTSAHVPEYFEKQEELTSLGVEEIIVFSVNDVSVMGAYAKEMKSEGTMIKFLADPHAEFTKALCMELTHPAADQLGFLNRCKRFAIYVVDGDIKFFKVSYAEDDPVGAEDKSSYVTEVCDSIRCLPKA